MTSALLLILQIGTAVAAIPEIEVIYPRSPSSETEVHIARVDSNFIFGSVTPPSSRLTIDGFKVKVEENGAFLAFLPVNWDEQRFVLIAVDHGDSSQLTLPFSQHPSPPEPQRPDIEFPALLKLNGGVTRTDPKGAYYIFPAPETSVIAEDWEDGYYKLPLSAGRYTWVMEKYVENIDPAPTWKPLIAWKGEVKPNGKWVEFRLPVGRQLLYRVWEESDLNRIFIELYHVISHIDKISYAHGIDPITEVVWDQPLDEVLRLEVALSEPCWGYNVKWDEGDLLLRVRKAPNLDRGIRGLHIAVDPGHGGENYGAIGPTGFHEKTANLRAAFALANLLNKKGAKVTITRIFDSYTGLYDRIEKAEVAEADILISLHYNALPDGANPFGDYGTGTHYYRPQSRLLAQSVQKELVKELRFPDEGIYYNNLALVRPTAMPAILIEPAYIMLPEQEARILEADFAEKQAKAVYRGLCSFIKQRRKLNERIGKP